MKRFFLFLIFFVIFLSTHAYANNYDLHLSFYNMATNCNSLRNSQTNYEWWVEIFDQENSCTITIKKRNISTQQVINHDSTDVGYTGGNYVTCSSTIGMYQGDSEVINETTKFYGHLNVVHPLSVYNSQSGFYWPAHKVLMDIGGSLCNDVEGYKHTFVNLSDLTFQYCGAGPCMNGDYPNPYIEPEDTLEKCTDTIDNDGDGQIDWADTDCQNLYENTLAKCTDGIDNDGDGQIDWADTDCQYLNEDTFEECTDTVDNDGDGLIDMQDEGCASYRENTLQKCRDGFDNDGDGLIDEEDPECAGLYQDEICGNGVDDDGDGLIDYQDPDCTGVGGNEICDNGIDDDNDGLIDSFDPDCDNQQGGNGTGTVSNNAGSGTTKMIAEDGDPVPYGTDLADVQYDDSVPDKGQVVEEDWDWLDVLFTSIGSHPIINVIRGCELTTSSEVSKLYVNIYDRNIEFDFDWLAQYLDYFGYFIVLGANIYAFYILYFRG